MVSNDLIKWRKSHDWTQIEAATALRISRRSYQMLEAGDYGRGKTEIDFVIALACSAIDANLKPYGEI